MDMYELLDDEDLFVEEDDDMIEDIDESYGEEDEFGERRRRRSRRRRAPRIRAGRTARGRGFVKPTPSRSPVSTSTLQASLDRVGKDIRTNASAIKRLEAQVKSATSKLNSVNNSQDKSIGDLRSDLKKQNAAMQQQNQINMLLPLLQKSPELEAKAGVSSDEAGKILNTVQIKKQDSTMALVLMMMASGQSSGGASASNMNMLLPLVLLMDKG